MDTINSLISLPLEDFFDKVSSLGTNIKYKYDDSSNLILLYVPYNACFNNDKSDFENKCRTAIINYSTKKVNVYVPNIQYNTISLPDINLKTDIIIECFEGTVVYVYYDNGWKISTRRCIDASKSFLHNKTKNHKLMFEECINMEFDKFTQYLIQTHCYAFTIVHYDNVHLIDYTPKFNKNYKKIILTTVTTHNTKMYNINSNIKVKHFFTNFDKISELFVVPKLLTIIKDVNNICGFNNDIKRTSEIHNEGVMLIRSGIMYKIHSDKYKKFKNVALEYNKNPGSIRHLIHLYQQNKLQEYFEEFQDDLYFIDKSGEKHNKIILINSIFNILASESYNFFLKFWKANENGIKNENYADMYKVTLTTSYKELFYIIRGMYFKYKAQQNKVTHSTVFNILKHNRSPDDIIKLIKGRKIMLQSEHLEAKRLQMIITEYDKNDFLDKYIKNLPTFFELFESQEP